MGDTFKGIGKPEPLKHLGAGVWSRRLTEEHRLVYPVREVQLDFLQAASITERVAGPASATVTSTM